MSHGNIFAQVKQDACNHLVNSITSCSSATVKVLELGQFRQKGIEAYIQFGFVLPYVLAPPPPKKNVQNYFHIYSCIYSST